MLAGSMVVHAETEDAADLKIAIAEFREWQMESLRKEEQTLPAKIKETRGKLMELSRDRQLPAEEKRNRIKAIRETLDAQKARLQALKSNQAEPGIPNLITMGGRKNTFGFIHALPMRSERTQDVLMRMRVLQIIDPNNALIQLENHSMPLAGSGRPSYTTAGRIYWLSDVDTSNWRDGQLVTFSKTDIYWLKGNRTYTNTLGANRTVTELKNVDDDIIQQLKAQPSRAAKVDPHKNEKDLKATQPRTREEEAVKEEPEPNKNTQK